jgi:hypothetical protein
VQSDNIGRGLQRQRSVQESKGQSTRNRSFPLHTKKVKKAASLCWGLVIVSCNLVAFSVADYVVLFLWLLSMLHTFSVCFTFQGFVFRPLFDDRQCCLSGLLSSINETMFPLMGLASMLFFLPVWGVFCWLMLFLVAMQCDARRSQTIAA